MDPQQVNSIRRTWWLALILVAAAALRIWYLAEIVHAPDFVEMRQDLSVQDYHARAILSGDWTLPEGRSDPKIATTPYYRPPAYTYLLSAIYFVTQGSYLAPRIFNVLLGLCSILLMYHLGKIMFGGLVAAITSALMATYWGFIYYEGEVNDPAVFVFLLPCLLLTLYHWRQSFSIRWVLLAGLITGCYALMRPNILAFGPVMAAWLLWTGWRAGRMRAVCFAWVTLAGVTALTILPVTLRNYFVSGEFVPISTYFGENLHIGNSEYSDGHTSWTPYLQELEGSGQFSVWEYDRIVRGLGREVGNEELTHSEASTIFARKAVAWIMANPGQAAVLTLKKAILFWSPWEITENKVLQYEKYHYPPLKYLPGFPYVFALFLFGTVIIIRDRLKKSVLCSESGSGKLPDWDMVLLVYGLIVVYWVSFLPFFVNARARHPLVGLLFLVGAYGIFRAVQLASERRWSSVALLGALFALLFCLASIDLVPYKPDKARWHYARADSWLRSGEIEKAKVEAENVLHEDYSLYMPFRLGHALALKGEYALAERLLRAALGSDREPIPYRQDLYFHIGVVLAADGRKDEARKAYEEALRLNPKDSRAHNDLGILLEKEGDEDSALRHYRAALEAHPEFALALSNMADLLGRRGDTAGAEAAFRKAMELEPKNPQHQYNLGVHLMSLGRVDEAAELYRSVLRLSPGDIRAMNNLGLLLADRGETDEAMELFRDAIALAPDFTLARANLGNLLVQTGDFEGGVAVYREGITLYPENAELLNGLGYQYFVHGDVTQAVHFYQEALRLQPEFTRARVNLAYAKAGMGDIGGALQEFELLAGKDPSNADYLLELGNLKAKAGRFEEAMQHYRQALVINPEFEAARKNLIALQEMYSPASR